MILAHRTRLNPTPEQEVYFRKACGVARFAFNWGLAEWKRRKELNPDEKCGPMQLQREFNTIKAVEFPFISEVAREIYQGGFKNLQIAMSNYYNSKAGKRKGRRIGFVKFKSRKGIKQSFGVRNDNVRFSGNLVKLPVLGWVNMAETLRFDGHILSCKVSLKAGRWYISVNVEMPDEKPIDHPVKSVGIDLGVKTLVTLSDGGYCENQAVYRKELNKLKNLNRKLARRVKGSHRREKAKLQLARLHERIANKRNDYSHKMTTAIAKTYKTICVEGLSVSGMVKNHKLALSISDASFGEIVRQLDYKTKRFGGALVRVDRFFPSSKLCSECGFKNEVLTLSDRQWICDFCGITHDRDLNAAKNIHAEGLRIYSGTG